MQTLKDEQTQAGTKSYSGCLRALASVSDMTDCQKSESALVIGYWFNVFKVFPPISCGYKLIKASSDRLSLSRPI